MVVQHQTGNAIIPLFHLVLKHKLYDKYGEAQHLFRAFVNNVSYESWSYAQKTNPSPEHICFAVLSDNNGIPIAWVLRWLDVGYSITGEYWRYTQPLHRNRGYCKLLLKTHEDLKEKKKWPTLQEQSKKLLHY
jgi:hypothetical protein